MLPKAPTWRPKSICIRCVRSVGLPSPWYRFLDLPTEWFPICEARSQMLWGPFPAAAKRGIWEL